MATLQQQIADKFLAKLADSKDVDAEKLAQLRALFAGGKKPRLAMVFTRYSCLPSTSDRRCTMEPICTGKPSREVVSGTCSSNTRPNLWRRFMSDSAASSR